MLAETISALSIIAPIMLMMIYAVVEASQAYLIASAMNNGAALAARALADYYQTNPEVVYTNSEQQAIFSNIRINGKIADNSQFTIPAGGWNLSSNPPTVTVVCSYLPGKGSPSLPPYPALDPLKLGSFIVSSSATYSLY